MRWSCSIVLPRPWKLTHHRSAPFPDRCARFRSRHIRSSEICDEYANSVSQRAGASVRSGRCSVVSLAASSDNMVSRSNEALGRIGVRDDIASAKSGMVSSFGSKREIRQLEQHLADGERVELMGSGEYGPGSGLIVLTNLRVLLSVTGCSPSGSKTCRWTESARSGGQRGGLSGP